MIDLNNKKALITGSSDGIGAATALLFSSLGAKVAIVGRDLSKLNSVAEQCQSKSPHGYKPVVIQADFIKDEDVVRTFQETISVFGDLDILINNAGLGSLKAFGEQGYLDDYDRVMQINVRSAVRLTELCVPHLNKSHGSIVNTSSVAALRPNPSSWSYCMSKAALDMFTKNMASKLAPHIRVNSVNPGITKTNFFSSRPDPKAILTYAEKQPLGRAADPTDIANVIAFLASDASRNMTGSIVVSDTGLLVADPYRS